MNRNSHRFELGVLSPAHSTGVGLLIAVGRTGELPILDATLTGTPASADPEVVQAQLASVAEALDSPFGLRLDALSSVRLIPLLEKLAGEGGGALLDFVLVAGECPDLSTLVAALRPHARRIFREVISLGEAEEASAAGVDGVVAKGNEGGGRVGSETTFVLLQHLCRRMAIPVWAQGGVGPHSMAACQGAGAQGVILDSQLGLAEESSLPDPLRTLVAAMDGSETICLGETLGRGFRVHRLRNAAAVRTLRDLEMSASDPAVFTQRLEEVLQRPEGEPLFPVGQDAALAGRLAARHHTAAGILRAYRRQATDNMTMARKVPPLAENGPLAAAHGTRFPIVQGPMTRVSDVASFADAVSRGGALPLLALALLREAQTERLLRETAALLGERSWGVGILGFVPPELRAEQLNAVLRVRPRFALLAGGRPDQARGLESQGIATYIHTPSVRLLEMFLKDGARKFVFEGRECGGHVGPLSSFMLWESALEVLLEFRRTHEHEEIHVLFAGGIHDSVSAAMVSALAAPAAAAGIKLGVLMGTAYLFTHEAVTAGAIVPSFQEEALRCEGTVLLDMGGGHAIRCAPSTYVEEFAQWRRDLLGSGAAPEEARARLEEMNVGRLRIASKGLTRVSVPEDGAGTSRLVEIPVERQKREGLYMIGQVAALRRELCSIEELHHDVISGAIARLGQLVPADDAVAAQPATGMRRREEPPAPVAIVGMAALFPGASDVRQFWSNILNRHDAVREVPEERWRTAVFYDANARTPDRVISKWGGFLDPILFDPLLYGIPPTSVWSVEPMQLLMLEVVRRSLQDAGFDHRPFDRERTGVIIGTGGGPSDLALAYQTRCMVEHYLHLVPDFDPAVRSGVIARLRQTLPELTEDSFPGVLPNVASGRVANRLNLGGPNFTVDAACASSLAALEVAVKELRYGTSDLMIVGAVDVQMSPFSFLMFSKTQALSAAGRCRPFDARADGITISEGVAAVLLKRLDDALRDGDKIYAVLRGIAGASDGREKSLTAPAVTGQRRALEAAYASAGLAPSSVGLVEAHGTGTVVGDRTEMETMRAVFEADSAAAQTCALGSVKSQIGHTKNAAGLAGLIKTTLALHHRVLPPTLVEEPNAAVRERSIPFYLNTRPRPWFHGRKVPRRAAVSAFGFGGTNFHAVLEEYAGHAASLDDRPAEVAVFCGSSRSELAQRLQSLAQALDRRSTVRLIDLAAALQREAAKARGTCRLAIVARNLDDLRSRLAAAAQALGGNTPLPDRGPIAYSEGPADGRVAFLFPGQGSQYLNMLIDLALYFPVVREVFERADRALTGILEVPLTRLIFPPPAYSGDEEHAQRRALDQTWYAQPALGAADFALYSLLADLGIAPDMVGGHSYGEYVALCAGGCLEFAELIRLSEQRGRIVQETQGRDAIGMVAVRASADALAEMMQTGTGVTIAGTNAPAQTIIGGPRTAIETFLPRLEAAGIPHQVLPMSAGFHIPEARPAAERFAAVLAQTQFGAPRLPIYSNRTAEVYPEDSATIRRILTEHLTKPVRFQDQVEAMYAAGARTFIEVGPSQVLSGLVRQILGDRPGLVLTPNRQGSEHALADFLQVVAWLYVRGASLRWERLFAGCEIRSQELSALLRDGDAPSSTAWLVDGSRAKPLRDLPRPRPSQADEHARTSPPPVASPRVVPSESTRAAPAAPPAVPAVPAPMATDGAASGAMAAFQSAMRQFLDYQEQAQRQRQQLMEQFLITQRAILEAYLTGRGDGQIPAPSLARSTVPEPGVAPSVAPAGDPREAPPTPVPDAPANTPQAQPETEAALPAVSSLPDLVLELVSERTGYPAEMLDLDYNMEADLGIDSIKRTEIFGALRQRMGLSGEAYEREEYFLTIRKLRTLREVLAWVSDQVAEASGLEPAAGNGEAASLPGETALLPRDTSEDARFTLTAGASPRRYVVRRVAAPLPEGQRMPRDQEVILITEDTLGMAHALANGMRAVGYRVALARPAAEFAVIGPGVYAVDLLAEPSVRELRDRIAQQHGKVTAVCHLLPLQPDASLSDVEGFEVKSLSLLANTFGVDLRDAGGTLIAVTGMGGTLGQEWNSTVFRSGQAGISGFLKSLAIEWPEVFIKAVDVDPNESPEYLATQLLAEVLTEDRTVEVGYTRGGRWGLVPVPSDLDERLTPSVEINADSVILVTGGARGITAAVCAELAARHRPRLVLVGRSPAPSDEDPETIGLTAASDLKRAIIERRKKRGEMVTPSSVEEEYQALRRAREIRVNLEGLSALGARIEYHALDVRDGQALEAFIASLYERHGRIDGVIHAAGVIRDALVLDKSPRAFDHVFDTKVVSALTLARALRPESLRFLVFFSSVVARFGNAGQADYTAANEVLNKLACKLDGEWPARVVSIGWGPWGEVGMLGQAEPALRSHHRRTGLEYHTPREGCERCLEEIALGRKGEPEVLIFASTEEGPRTAGAGVSESVIRSLSGAGTLDSH